MISEWDVLWWNQCSSSFRFLSVLGVSTGDACRQNWQSSRFQFFFCWHLRKVHILSKLFLNLFDCTHIFSCHYTLQYSEMQWQAGRLWQQFSRTYQASSNSLFLTKITLPDDYCASLTEQLKSILLKKYSTVVLLIHLPMLNISKPLKTNQNWRIISQMRTQYKPQNKILTIFQQNFDYWTLILI